MYIDSFYFMRASFSKNPPEEFLTTYRDPILHILCIGVFREGDVLTEGVGVDPATLIL